MLFTAVFWPLNKFGYNIVRINKIIILHFIMSISTSISFSVSVFLSFCTRNSFQIFSEMYLTSLWIWKTLENIQQFKKIEKNQRLHGFLLLESFSEAFVIRQFMWTLLMIFSINWTKILFSCRDMMRLKHINSHRKSGFQENLGRFCSLRLVIFVIIP